MIYYIDEKYSFIEYFNECNGFLFRSDVLKKGQPMGIDPHMRSFPELLDIGIMGKCIASENGICKAAGIDCYQNAIGRVRPNMSYYDYCNIINQCKGKTFQVALGGAGDPNKHEAFEDILNITRNNHIVPNLTTSGYNLTDAEIDLFKKYCGAVAVSFYTTLNANFEETNPSTIKTINRLVEAQCITNVHYVISKDNIKEAIYRLENNMFPSGINSIVFLLYKSVGLGKTEKVLKGSDETYRHFIQLATKRRFDFKIGFDTCQTPALKAYVCNVADSSLDFCEASRFSMYIDCDMMAYPCSFGYNNKKYSVNLKQYSILDAWNSCEFDSFRNKQDNICVGCTQKHCYTCALELDIDTCGKRDLIKKS